MRQISERIISDVKVVNLENFDVEIVEGVRIDEAVEWVVVHDYRRQVGERAEGSSLKKEKKVGLDPSAKIKAPKMTETRVPKFHSCKFMLALESRCLLEVLVGVPILGTMPNR